MDIPQRRPIPAPLVRDFHQVTRILVSPVPKSAELNEYYRLDPDLAAFLGSQPEIRDLSLRGTLSCASDPFTLPPSALPHLETFRSVYVDPDTLGEVRTCIPEQRVPPFSVRLELMEH